MVTWYYSYEPDVQVWSAVSSNENPGSTWRIGYAMTSATEGNLTNRVAFYLKNSTSGTSYTATARVYNDSGVLQYTSTNSFAQNTLSTTGEYYTFEFADFTPSDGWYFMCEVNTTGGDANWLGVGNDGDTADLMIATSMPNTNFPVQADRIMQIKLGYDGSPPSPGSSGTLLPPPPAMVRL